MQPTIGQLHNCADRRRFGINVKETLVKPTFLIATTAIALAGGLSACTSPADPTGAPAKPASIQDSCINPTQIQKQKIVSDQEIQFTLAGGEVWVNKLPRSCPGLKFEQGFSWKITGGLVCSNQQTITVNNTGTFCQLGEFSRVPAAAAQ